MNSNTKRRLYFDMDGTLVDFQSGIDRLGEEEKSLYKDHLDDVPGIFSKMDPIEGAIEAVKRLSEHYDCYILSTAPWNNPSAWTDKVEWVKSHFGNDEEGSPFWKKVMLTHHKNLLNDGFSLLIDDRTEHGASAFGERHIKFDRAKKNWKQITDELIEMAGEPQIEVGNEKFFCLNNEWEEGRFRMSLELSRTKTPRSTLLVVGVNPGGKTDPQKGYIGKTVTKVMELVGKEYDSCLFVNLTPCIAAKPKELDSKKISNIHGQNIQTIESLVGKRKLKRILLCYGNNFICGGDCFSEVLRLLNGKNFFCLGKPTEKGYPKHPLFVKEGTKLAECRVDADSGMVVLD